MQNILDSTVLNINFFLAFDAFKVARSKLCAIEILNNLHSIQILLDLHPCTLSAHRLVGATTQLNRQL
jgi:hypothetical protein